MKPIISIVGRPNVGKSTLFNRLIGHRKAITEDIPGVTRDRNYGDFEYNGQDFTLVDTGGFEPSTEEGYFPLIKEQIFSSMDESSAIIFVVDAKSGLVPQDEEIADLLRKSRKPVFCVINKVESKNREIAATEFYRLGVLHLYPVSSLHGLGLPELLEDICKKLREPDRAEENTTEHGPALERRIAFAGRPNTGKSSLTNRILGAERMIVSNVPGTTRDSIDTKFDCNGQTFILIDTAGLRRKSRVSEKLEEYSVSSAVNTIERADVVNLVIDAMEGARHQDAAIAHLIMSRGKGLVIIANKWDIVDTGTTQKKYRELLKERIPHASYSPVLFTSAKTGYNIDKIIETDVRVYDQMTRRIATPKLNESFQSYFEKLAISHQKGRQVKIYYAHQAKTVPPTFVLFSNHPDFIPEHYKRYLENSLRETYGFQGTPIRLLFRKK